MRFSTIHGVLYVQF